MLHTGLYKLNLLRCLDQETHGGKRVYLKLWPRRSPGCLIKYMILIGCCWLTYVNLKRTSELDSAKFVDWPNGRNRWERVSKESKYWLLSRRGEKRIREKVGKESVNTFETETLMHHMRQVPSTIRKYSKSWWDVSGYDTIVIYQEKRCREITNQWTMTRHRREK